MSRHSKTHTGSEKQSSANVCSDRKEESQKSVVEIAIENIINNLSKGRETTHILENTVKRLVMTFYKSNKKNKIGNESNLEIVEKTLENRTEIIDICYLPKGGGKVVVRCNDGLYHEIQDFINYCTIHGLIPIVNKIYIGNKDVSEMKYIYDKLLLKMKSNNPLIMSIINHEQDKNEFKNNEIKSAFHYIKSTMIKIMNILTINNKCEKKVLATISKCFDDIMQYYNVIYPFIAGPNLEKICNDGALSENVFIEIANWINKHLGIEDSYLVNAGYEADIKRKTDMNFVIKKENKYLIIPVQYTIKNAKISRKESDVEKYLEESEIEKFILLIVNGNFGEFKKNRYKNWFSTRREKNNGDDFPQFIKTTDKRIFKSEIITYIALNMIYKNFNFKEFNEESIVTQTNSSDNNAIQLNDENNLEGESDKIDFCKISFEYENTSIKNLLKHIFEIRYCGEYIGEIVIYNRI